MSEAAGIIERSDVILDELAKLGLSLARDLHQRAIAAETAEDATRLAMAFHHISRSIRQTLALPSRLAREARLTARETVQDAERRRERRKDEVRACVQRAIWSEAERWETLPPKERLELQLAADAQSDDFVAGPASEQIARICCALGLKPPPAATPAQAATATAAAPPGPIGWRSSA